MHYEKHSTSETTVYGKWDKFSLISCEWDKRSQCLWFAFIVRFTHMPHVVALQRLSARCSLIVVVEEFMRLSALTLCCCRWIANGQIAFFGLSCSMCFFLLPSVQYVIVAKKKMHWMYTWFKNNFVLFLVTKDLFCIAFPIPLWLFNELIAINYFVHQLAEWKWKLKWINAFSCLNMRVTHIII